MKGRYGIEWKQLGTHNKPLSVLDFEKQEQAKEVAELEEKCAEFRGELGQIQEQITLAGAEMEQLQEDAKEAREEAPDSGKIGRQTTKTAQGTCPGRQEYGTSPGTVFFQPRPSVAGCWNDRNQQVLSGEKPYLLWQRSRRCCALSILLI